MNKAMLLSYINNANDSPPKPKAVKPSILEDALDMVPEIDSMVIHLQQHLQTVQPLIFAIEKCVEETLAPVYKNSDREQQQYINREAARLMTQRDEEEQLKMDNQKTNTVSNINQPNTNIKSTAEQTKDAIKKAYKDYEKAKGHKASDVQAFMQFCKKIKKIQKANWSLCKEVITENEIKLKKRQWNDFVIDYNKFNEDDSKENCQSLRNILNKLQTFAKSDQRHCIDGLLNCSNSNMVFENFMGLTKCKDDKIREGIVNILQTLYDFSDDNFVEFANKNNIIEYLSKALRVSYSLEESKHHTFQLTPECSSRVDMKILQILAVYFTGQEILYHTVFNEIKESIMSPHQHIDFIDYALQVIVTIIEDDKKNAKKWINSDSKNDMNIDHTIQFAVYTIQTYAETQSDLLARALLKALRIDVSDALIDFGMVIDENNETQNIENENENQNQSPPSPPSPQRKVSPIHISESTTATYSMNVPAAPSGIMVTNMAYVMPQKQNQNQPQYAMHSPYNSSNVSNMQMQMQQRSSYMNVPQYSHTQANSMNTPYSPYQQQYTHQSFTSQSNYCMPQSYHQPQYSAQYYQQQQYQPQQQTYSTNLNVNSNGYNTMHSPYNSGNIGIPQSPYQQQQQTYSANLNVNMMSGPRSSYNAPPQMNTHTNNLPQLQAQSLNLRRMSSDVPIQDKLHSTLAQLLLTGCIMTKYASIHTHIPNYEKEISKSKHKYKLVKMSNDWKNIEFHPIDQKSVNAHTTHSNITPIKTKGKPKVLKLALIKYVKSAFSDSKQINQKQVRDSKSKHFQDLFIYALDKTKKEIVIKLICQSRNHTKRWTIALNQIIDHFKKFGQ